MAVIGVASIRVRPDLTKFREDLDAGLRKIKSEFTVGVNADTDRAERQIKQMIDRFEGRNIKLDTEINTRKLKNTETDLQKIRRVLPKVASGFGSVSKQAAKTTARTVAFSAAIASVASSISGTASLIGGLGQAVVALGAATGGVALAGVAALGVGAATVKIGLVGMGDAMKAIAEGDAKAFNEALKNLAPNARAFAVEVQKLKPLFDQIRLSVQQELFRGLAREIGLTGRALSGVTGSTLVQLGKIFNNVAVDILGFMREADTIKRLTAISQNVVGGFREVQTAGRSAFSIIVDLLRSTSELLPGLGQSIETIAAKFAAFIRVKSDSGELTKFFQDAIESTKQFGRVLRDTGVAIANIFQIGSGATGGFLNTLERAAAGFRDFTESIGGQFIIGEIIGVIRDLSGAFGQFLGALRPILPVIGEFARLLADSVTQILRELGPVIASLASVLLKELGKALPILIPFIIELAKGIGKILEAAAPLLPVIAKLFTALTPLIDPLVRLAETIFPILADILEILAPLIEAVARVIGLMVDGIVLLLKPIGWLIDGLNELIDVLKSDTFEGSDWARDLEKRFGDLESAGSDAASSVARGVQDTGHELFDAIAHLIDGSLFIIAGQKPEWEQGGMSLMEAFNNSLRAQTALSNQAIETMMNGIIDLIGGKSNEFDVKGHQMGKSFSDGFTEEQRAMLDKVRQAIQNLLDVISGRKPAFEQEGRDISTRLGSGITGNQATAVNAARSASIAVAGAFGGVSLFAEGAAIMASLHNGIVSGIQAVKNVLTSMTSLIPSWKGPMSLDRVLLVPTGEAIMGGLIRSIESKVPELESVLRGVTATIGGAFETDPAVSAAINRNISISNDSAPVPVRVFVDVNEGNLNGVIDVRIDEGNRGVRRRVAQGVSS